MRTSETASAAGTATAELERFRRDARSWLAANLQLDVPGGRGARRFRHLTPEDVTAERALQRRLFDAGYAGIATPTEYGGQGLSQAHQRAFDQEAAAYRLPDFGVVSGTTELCLRTMLAHGGPDLLVGHVPRILAGDEVWAQFFSETEAGSDLAGVRTRAEWRDGRWVINGGKVWSSGAYFCDYGMALTRTNWTVPKHRGLTWFAIPLTAPGVSVLPINQINGDTEFCQEFFDDVTIEDSERIGAVDDGWTVAQTVLVLERGFAEEGATSSANLAGEVSDLIRLARKSGNSDDPVVRQQVAAAMISDFAVATVEERVQEHMAVNGSADAGVAAYAALAAGVAAPERAKIAIRIAGLHALMWSTDDPGGAVIAEEYLNSRRKAIAGGTNEIQRNAIGERVLGLPREPSFDSRKPFGEVIRDAKNWNGRVS
ncbi:acyl-CoA dehydrogenase family protein [uncultured Jatrophihabitans sp.]|uniref:acyl-CoA dehydrogenase family protein n=1 Tax=uncultured Jatrophihabitans sp. TaxID=1610747 RepID=UPI0035CA9A29